MDVQIKAVENLKDLKRFIRFPVQLYRDNRYYVPDLYMDELKTLRSDRNPAFEHCDVKQWLAYKDGRIAGRIMGIINHPHIKKWKQKYARFGWVDFIDDPEVSKSLMNTLESWAKSAGMEAVHGPLGFTDLDLEGMLVEGFEELSTLVTIYNYPYYPVHLENLGYVKDVDWVEYEMPVPEKPNEKIARIADISLRRNRLTILETKKKRDLLPYAKELFDVLEITYKDLYGAVPLTEAQVDAYIKQYFGFIRPEFVPVVLDQNGKMVAFGITIPSLSRALQKSRGRILPFGWIYLLRALRRNELADLYLVGVKPEYQGKGVNAILMHQMNLVYNRLGVRRAESNPELETNRDVQGQWKYYERRQHKRRRIYIKHLI